MPCVNTGALLFGLHDSSGKMCWFFGFFFFAFSFGFSFFLLLVISFI